MNKLQFASKLLLIEAKTAEVRAHSLLGDDTNTIKSILELRKFVSDICLDILSPDETKIYIAK